MSVILSVSIVVYQNYGDAKAAVDSIERYTSPQIQKRIFVIDNSHFSEHCIQKEAFITHLAQYADVVYLDTHKNQGFGKGHNYVMDQLDSEYHAIVNPDILLESDAFSALLAFMKRTQAGMAVPRLIDDSGEQLDVYRREPTVFDMYLRMFTKSAFRKRKNYHSLKDRDYTRPFEVPFAQGSFLVIKTALWKQLGGFDESYFMYMEDADLCKRVNQVSQLLYCPDATVIHKWEKASHRNFKLFSIHTRSMITYFNKWGWKFH